MSIVSIVEAELQRLIHDAEEEGLTLDYKAAASLAKSEGKKTEITKDVSAMANAAGGRIIYGIKEFDDAANRHRPERLDAIDRREISKEWLDQVIGSIRPRIDGVIITPVQLSSAPDHVAYVVDIPQSSTAHQAGDKRYYRRYNFESVPMYDHEIRDVMSRSQHPRLSISLQITIETMEVTSAVPYPGERARREDVCTLEVWANNEGERYAKYVNGLVSIPRHLVPENDRHRGTVETVNGQECLTRYFDNTERDVVGIEKGMFPRPIHGPSWFSPLLPGNQRRLKTLPLAAEVHLAGRGAGHIVHWTVHADNALPLRGGVRYEEIPVDDQR